MDGGSATQGYEMSGTRLTNRSWTRSAGREGGGRQGEGTSALPPECAAQLSPVYLTQLKIPSGRVPGEGAWGSSVRATLPFRGVDGPGRIEPRLDQRLSGHIQSSFCSKNCRQASGIRNFGAAAQGAWMSDTEGAG